MISVYQQAAGHVHRFLTLDEHVLRMSAGANEGLFCLLFFASLDLSRRLAVFRLFSLHRMVKSRFFPKGIFDREYFCVIL